MRTFYSSCHTRVIEWMKHLQIHIFFLSQGLKLTNIINVNCKQTLISKEKQTQIRPKIDDRFMPKDKRYV